MAQIKLSLPFVNLSLVGLLSLAYSVPSFAARSISNSDPSVSQSSARTLTKEPTTSSWDLTTANELNYFGARPRKMTTAFRAVPVIGYGVFNVDGFKSRASSMPTMGLLLQYGRSWLQFELGGVFMNMQMSESIGVGSTAAKVDYSLNYVGIPVVAKYAFLTKPNASFFVKAGVMPLILASHSTDRKTSASADAGFLPPDGNSQNNDGNENTDNENAFLGLYESSGNDSQYGADSLDSTVDQAHKPRDYNTLGIVGIGGTADIGDNRSLLLDITGYHSFDTAFENSGESTIKGVSLMLGMAFGF